MQKAKVIFNLEGVDLYIQCSKGEKMRSICQKYSTKIKQDLDSLLFLYGGNQLNLDLTFDAQASSMDKNNNEMRVLVYAVEEKKFTCPKCGGKIKFDTEIIDEVIASYNEIKETINGIKSQIENAIKNSMASAMNSQLKNINKMLDMINQDISKNNEKLKNFKPIEKESPPIFTIRSSCDENKCLESKSLQHGERTQIWSFEPNKKSQIFELEKSTKNGYYLIKNHFSGYYVGMDGSGIFMKRKNENSQNFKFIDCKNGFYIIENESGFVVDLGNWKTDNGNIISSSGKSGSSAQQWKLVLL